MWALLREFVFVLGVLVVLEQNDDDGQRGSGVHESENREETVKDRERRPFFGIARQDLEGFDDLHAFLGFHHLKESVDVQRFDNAITEERQEEHWLFVFVIRVLMIVKFDPEGIEDSHFDGR